MHLSECGLMYHVFPLKLHNALQHAIIKWHLVMQALSVKGFYFIFMTETSLFRAGTSYLQSYVQKSEESTSGTRVTVLNICKLLNLRLVYVYHD